MHKLIYLVSNWLLYCRDCCGHDASRCRISILTRKENIPEELTWTPQIKFTESESNIEQQWYVNLKEIGLHYDLGNKKWIRDLNRVERWTGCIWLRIGTSGSSLWMWYSTLGFIACVVPATRTLVLVCSGESSKLKQLPSGCLILGLGKMPSIISLQSIQSWIWLGFLSPWWISSSQKLHSAGVLCLFVNMCTSCLSKSLLLGYLSV
jgi:hypothetical protein